MRSRRPRSGLVVTCYRMVILVALAVSAALLADSLRPTGAFCGEGSGCAAVKQSGLGRLFGVVPLPLVGLSGFALLLGLSLRRGAMALWALRVGSTIAAVAGLAFLVVMMLVIGRICWLCAVVDGAAMVAGALAWLVPGGRSASRELMAAWAWPALGVLAVGAPLVWGLLISRPRVPESIAALYLPGRINVVEFVDFECPSCRELHQRLIALLKPHGTDVHLVRRHYPLARHPQARTAARAVLCAEEQGQGDALAEALFALPNLASATIFSEAQWLGLDMARFQRCLDSGKSDEILREHRALLQGAGFSVVPVVFIGERVLTGLRPEAEYAAALAEAAAAVDTSARDDRPDGSAVTATVFFAGVALLAGLVAVLGRRSAMATSSSDR